MPAGAVTKLRSIKSRRDFLAARGAPGVATPGFRLVRRKREDMDAPRAGFTITKKLGNAVVRNRIRRRLRAAIAEVLLTGGEAGCDYIVIARARAADRPFALLLDDLEGALLTLAQKGA
ncbi:MAG: ribonuclease P protein component [Alphaproteobacteria bacterium]|nr:ribonuclease P protein component [Alphaproteobacteria bacterium]